MTIDRLAQLFWTARYIQPSQLAQQVVAVLRSRLENPGAFAKQECPPWPGCRGPLRSAFLPPGTQQNRPGDLRKGLFTFLNVTKDLGWPPRWQCAELFRHWRYYVHYFDYLWALGFDDAKRVVEDWMARHPLASGNYGWDAYPTSLRIMNFCGYFFLLHRRRLEADVAFRDALWRSLFLQAEWLSRHFEFSVGGNHLFENGAALAVAGSCFDGAAAAAWIERALRLMRREIPRQILGDGMHCGRTPMYHSRMVYIFALLADSGHPSLVSQVREPLRKMAVALARMCHPDGDIALINDSASGTYNRPQPLLESVRKVLGSGEEYPDACGSSSFPESGFFVTRDEGGDYLLIDAGPAAHYIPGHSHGGIFSFELSLRGHRVIVDSGLYDYEPGEMRAYCRSTRAHNTVEIDGLDQSEYWSVFRVARRGLPRDVKWAPFGGGFRLSGWHDGYCRLPKRVRHERRFVWYDGGVLLIRDQVNARSSATTVARLHLHPECSVRSHDAKHVVVDHPGGSFTICFAGDGAIQLEKSFYCPEFGLRRENTAVAFRCEGTRTGVDCCVAIGDVPVTLEDAGARVGDRVYAW